MNATNTINASETTANKYDIRIGEASVGRLRHLRTEKGDRWVLSFYGADPKDDRTFRFRGFDEAYAAAYSKKPSGSMVVRYN